MLARGRLFFLLLLAAPRADADVIFDFSGICQSGDCEPGSTVNAELRFTEDAPLRHRDRAVTADDFVSLTLDYEVKVHKVRVTPRWSPTTGTNPILPLDVVIDPLGLLRELLLRDDLKNLFRVGDIDDGGAWEYRQVTTAPDGTIEIDLTLAGIGGAFAPRRSSTPEPAPLLLLGLALAGLSLHRAISPGRRGGTGARGSSG